MVTDDNFSSKVNVPWCVANESWNNVTQIHNHICDHLKYKNDICWILLSHWGQNQGYDEIMCTNTNACFVLHFGFQKDNFQQNSPLTQCYFELFVVNGGFCHCGQCLFSIWTINNSRPYKQFETSKCLSSHWVKNYAWQCVIVLILSNPTFHVK
jgi:hypothetical protein